MKKTTTSTPKTTGRANKRLASYYVEPTTTPFMSVNAILYTFTCDNPAPISLVITEITTDGVNRPNVVKMVGCFVTYDGKKTVNKDGNTDYVRYATIYSGAVEDSTGHKIKCQRATFAGINVFFDLFEDATWTVYALERFMNVGSKFRGGSNRPANGSAKRHASTATKAAKGASKARKQSKPIKDTPAPMNAPQTAPQATTMAPVEPTTAPVVEPEPEPEPEPKTVKLKDGAAKMPAGAPQLPNNLNAWELLAICVELSIPVYLCGPAGCGKNYSVQKMAVENGWDFFYSGSIFDEFKLSGYRDAKGDYQETEFYKALTNESESIMMLDEIDASDPSVLVAINSALANGYFSFPHKTVFFDVNKVHFVAAGNTVGNGADDLYTGRTVLDSATLDRFAVIMCDYDEAVEIEMAAGDVELVEMVHDIRDTAKREGVRMTVSYRALKQITALYKRGISKVQALQLCIINKIDMETARTLAPTRGGAWADAYRDALNA